MKAPDQPRDHARVLLGAAFGADPGRHPLPPAATDEQAWWRGVALGGQGRYAAAAAVLGELVGPGNRVVLRSLALSTLASHRRQVGAHTDARRADGAALALLGRRADLLTEEGEGAGRLRASACCDALVGLAADALGPGRTALARALLARAVPHREAADPRCAVRWSWVAAETELWAGSPGAAARHARTAGERAAAGASVRHRVKSDLVVAAVDGDGAAARSVLVEAERHGLLPLAWAAEMLLAATTPSGAPGGRARAGRNTARHDLLAHRGAGWPPGPRPARS